MPAAGLLLLLVPVVWCDLPGRRNLEAFVAGHDVQIDQGKGGGMRILEEELYGGHSGIKGRGDWEEGNVSGECKHGLYANGSTHHPGECIGECKRLFCFALSLLDCINIVKMNEKTRFRMKSDKAEKGFR